MATLPDSDTGLRDSGAAAGRSGAATSQLVLSDSVSGALRGLGTLPDDFAGLSDTGASSGPGAVSTSNVGLSDDLTGLAVGPGYLSDTLTRSDQARSVATIGLGVSRVVWTDSLTGTLLTPVIHLQLNDFLLRTDQGQSLMRVQGFDDNAGLADHLTGVRSAVGVFANGSWRDRLFYVFRDGSWEPRRMRIRRDGTWT
jgi:hypothetical protein